MRGHCSLNWDAGGITRTRCQLHRQVARYCCATFVSVTSSLAPRQSCPPSTCPSSSTYTPFDPSGFAQACVVILSTLRVDKYLNTEVLYKIFHLGASWALKRVSCAGKPFTTTLRVTISENCTASKLDANKVELPDQSNQINAVGLYTPTKAEATELPASHSPRYMSGQPFTRAPGHRSWHR